MAGIFSCFHRRLLGRFATAVIIMLPCVLYGLLYVWSGHSIQRFASSYGGGNGHFYEASGAVSRRTLIRLQKHIVLAQKRARSATVVQHLTEAHAILNEILDFDGSENSTTEPISATKADNLVDVCREEWKGIHYGYPRFETGHVLTACNNSRPFWSVVNFVLDASKMSVAELYSVLSQVSFNYAQTPVHLCNGADALTASSNSNNASQDLQKAIQSAVNDGVFVNQLSSSLSSPLIFHSRQSAFELLNSGLIATKYVVLLFDMQMLSGLNASISRLLGGAFYDGFDVLGGAFRTSDGLWQRNCFQMGLKNYTLKLVEGYDMSLSCLLCDFMAGPFLVRTEILREFPFEKRFDLPMILLDWFLRLKRAEKIVGVCPDVMFELKSGLADPNKWTKEALLPFASEWELNRILYERIEFRFSCSELGLSCKLTAGIAHPPCCLEEIALVQKAAHDVCVTRDIYCEICSGSQLGACKVKGILPWELDFDLGYFAGDHGKWAGASEELKLKGYKLDRQTDYDARQGMHLLWSANVRGELWGSYAQEMSQYWLYERRLNASRENDSTSLSILPNITRMMVYGSATNAYYNPCLVSRNEYGPNIFRHAEHWRMSNKPDGWQKYAAGFIPCPRPGFHGCLDQFLPDGDLQFRDDYLV